LKFPQIPAENSVIPGNSSGNSWDGGFHSRWPCPRSVKAMQRPFRFR